MSTAGAGQQHALARLGDLRDWQIASGDPDIRGWDLVSSDGCAIGPVKELIVDLEARKVRLIEVELDGRRCGLPGLNHRVLIPLGDVDLDPARRQVRLDVLSSAGLLRLPPYAGGVFASAEHEAHFRAWVQIEASLGINSRGAGSPAAAREVGSH